MRRFIPSVFTGLRARLVLGFLVVTLISLLLVFATLPRLLDSYFLDQAQQDLNRNTQKAGFFVALELLRYQGSGSDAPRPILEGTPLVVAAGAREALGSADEGRVLEIAQLLAQSNITVQIAPDADNPGEIAYELDVPVGDEVAQAGQQRESLRSSTPYQLDIPDSFWSQSAGAA